MVTNETEECRLKNVFLKGKFTTFYWLFKANNEIFKMINIFSFFMFFLSSILFYECGLQATSIVIQWEYMTSVEIAKEVKQQKKLLQLQLKISLRMAIYQINCNLLMKLFY